VIQEVFGRLLVCIHDKVLNGEALRLHRTKVKEVKEKRKKTNKRKRKAKQRSDASNSRQEEEEKQGTAAQQPPAKANKGLRGSLQRALKI
jgi:hypothetical protein